MKEKSVKEINSIIENISTDEYLKYIDILKDDERKSVKNIAVKLAKKLDKMRAENERLEMINIFENEGYEKGFTYIGGIDEAGRGPLAGPVVAAVVVFKPGTKIEGINDSKKLSEAKRDELFEIIKEEALDYGIGIVQKDEIDEYNILNATYMAMKKAVNCLKQKPDYLLVDAAHIPDVDIEQKSIIKGDSKSISIAAASILAKVTRDSIMYEYDKMYPEYGFASHKGYGTDQHYKAIREHGITSIHRRSFLKNIL
ncbi:ribonuclease HII [[Clostridium] sordellii]|uniref:Ribonuclease HII n=1 Tax=Paraclostridium sordellii TaxID=1505 RepID=A0A9P1PB90_PARSO|nr:MULTISPECIES: ribonuclease HII [Paeniclostridium]MDU5020801.1 ribonuclease HII [Clostridiales bacterium]AUN15325.1 ribonuclease HII [Paeniclostridium sordellii]EPZ60402.1 ribonuclease HII family protein [[Clostridium] sordellii VPI 9048] [Paeniclostridium sordellii VPI 9048]MBS6025513.1 ribonuclease HII [Paeniclostridium sordellii]MBW4861516.1 ribonuclease HII [Paeniclostridium sp.]